MGLLCSSFIYLQYLSIRILLQVRLKCIVCILCDFCSIIIINITITIIVNKYIVHKFDSTWNREFHFQSCAQLYLSLILFHNFYYLNTYLPQFYILHLLLFCINGLSMTTRFNMLSWKIEQKDHRNYFSRLNLIFKLKTWNVQITLIYFALSNFRCKE